MNKPNYLKRRLADDSNVLLNRCEARKPLSLAEQIELFAWFQERGTIISDMEERLENYDDLLAVCKAVATWLACPDLTDLAVAAIRETCRAAIAKAEEMNT